MIQAIDSCYHGHVLDVLRSMPDECVQMVVTSPPYRGLRDYGTPPQVWGGEVTCQHEWGDSMKLHKGGPHGDSSIYGGNRAVVGAQAATQNIDAGAWCQRCGAWRGQLGLEPTPELYVAHITEIFREVRRVLRADGTLWLNLGDSYATGGCAQGEKWRGGHEGKNGRVGPMTQPNRMPIPGLKPKDRVGIPHMVAFALRADGWYWRDEIVWHKRACMPESVTDRCTKAHEFVFMFSKRERYFYDYAAIEEPATFEGPNGRQLSPYAQGFGRRSPEEEGERRVKRSGNKERKPASARGVPVDTNGSTNGAVAGSIPWEGTTRRKRSVWSLLPDPFPEAHFATFPRDLPTTCVLAGSRAGDVVLDPFMGSGTTAEVAQSLGRHWIGIELSEEYLPMQQRRARQRGLAL